MFLRLVLLAVTGGMLLLSGTGWAQAPAAQVVKPIKLVVLGDSLTAGYGLPAAEAFPVRLEQALKGKGIVTEIINAGVSGDTSTGGLDRLDWSVPQDAQGVIVELGANDALRGTDPKVTRAVEGAQYPGPALRHAGAAELRQRLHGAVQRDLSGVVESLSGAAISVLPGWRGDRCKTHPAGRAASDR
jgi:lysophospholipase L1-like esterase